MRDDKALLALKEAGKAASLIAKEIGRTPIAVTSRLAHLRRQQRMTRLLNEQSRNNQ
jgi:hypothetical protein